MQGPRGERRVSCLLSRPRECAGGDEVRELVHRPAWRRRKMGPTRDDRELGDSHASHNAHRIIYRNLMLLQTDSSKEQNCDRSSTQNQALSHQGHGNPVCSNSSRLILGSRKAPAHFRFLLVQYEERCTLLCFLLVSFGRQKDKLAYFQSHFRVTPLDGGYHYLSRAARYQVNILFPLGFNRF